MISEVSEAIPKKKQQWTIKNIRIEKQKEAALLREVSGGSDPVNVPPRDSRDRGGKKKINPQQQAVVDQAASSATQKWNSEAILGKELAISHYRPLAISTANEEHPWISYKRQYMITNYLTAPIVKYFLKSPIPTCCGSTLNKKDEKVIEENG
ncbi:hypothetical protein TrLO_g14737 [Triparma laevis f. longispina]|uniref:Uncharacterized protein n=1 Tax=Triparma laevis f. longispina TaxID=1714387 RepID=A0A9W7FGM8_9STRA|nr:hypothetical protein TrLO_g14737 [Triparma laevis f. longispina]